MNLNKNFENDSIDLHVLFSERPSQKPNEESIRMLKLMLDLCADVNIADRNDGSLLRHDWPMQIARIVVPEPNFKIFFTKRLTIVSSSAVGVECYCV